MSSMFGVSTMLAPLDEPEWMKLLRLGPLQTFINIAFGQFNLGSNKHSHRHLFYEFPELLYFNFTVDRRVQSTLQ